jgi:hypothetical protein
MKRKYFLGIFMFSLIITAACNKEKPILSKGFIKYFGGIDVDVASEAKQTPDGGYVMIGSSNSFGSKSDMYLVKTDAYGNEQWHKTFGDTLDDEGSSVQVVWDGGYILLGTITYNGGSTDMLAVRLSSAGDTIWTKKLGNSGFKERGASVSITNGNGFIFLGSTDNTSNGTLDLFAIKTDASGTMVGFPFSYGTTSTDDNPSCIIQSYDNDYIISSSTLITSPTPRLVKFNEFSGNIPSNAPALNNDGIPALVTGGEISKTHDGNYIMTGTNAANNVYLLKLNPSLDSLYAAKTFGGSKGEEGLSVQPTSDGGYIIVGTTQSFGQGLKDIYLVKTDAVGNLQWYKTFGGTGNDVGKSVRQTSDGGYIISGTIKFGTSTTNKDNIMCLIKTDENGDIKNK